MDKIKSAAASIVLLILLCSGIFARIVDFGLWLFLLQNSQPDVSIVGQVFIRILVFVVSFELVGLLFNALGWYNGVVMKGAYFVISTLCGFLFAYVVWTIENYYLQILIGLSVIVVVLLIILLIKHFSKKQEKESIDDE